MLTFTPIKIHAHTGKLPVDKLWITRVFPVDNPVDKLWISCGLLWATKLSTGEFTNYPQGYPQGYPQENWVLSSFKSRGFSFSSMKKWGPLLQLFIYKY